jgi:succinate dehydrogenase flavin-adding protein (antitoxin of CptAB toxin-antitoxin module)
MLEQDFADLSLLSDNQLDYYLYLLELQSQDTQALITALENEIFEMKQKTLLLKIENLKRKQSGYEQAN